MDAAEAAVWADDADEQYDEPCTGYFSDAVHTTVRIDALFCRRRRRRRRLPLPALPPPPRVGDEETQLSIH